MFLFPFISTFLPGPPIFFLLIFLRTLFFKPVNISWSLHFVTVRGTGIDQQLHKVLMNALALTLNEAVCGWAPRLPGSCWEGAGGLSFAADGYTGFARLGLSRLTFGISLFPCSNLDGQVGGLEDGGDGDMWHCTCSLLILWAVVAWNKAYIRRTRPSWVLSNFRRGAVARLAMAPRGRYTTQPALWRCLVLPDGRRTRRRLYPVPGGDESRPWDTGARVSSRE